MRTYGGPIAYPRPVPRRHRGRWLRWPALVLALLCAVVLAGAGILWATTPGVGDAMQRVRDLDAARHVTYRDTPVPGRFADALIAAEDSRFYSHPGVDPIGVLHAAWRALAERGQDPGGSTLDQQLAKQLYGGGRSGSPALVAQQATLAVKLDSAYSKRQILTMYASVAYFGHGYYGLHDARVGYFGRATGRLTWGQAALLAGLVQAPSAYDPVLHPEAATARKSYVLARLVAAGRLTSGQAHTIAAEPLRLAMHGA